MIKNLKIADVQKYMLDMFEVPERFLLLFEEFEFGGFAVRLAVRFIISRP